MIEDPRAPLPHYPCEKIVFRAIPYPDWRTKDGRPTNQLFYYKPDRDGIGLSVSPTVEDCRDNFTAPIYGIVSLHVGRIRDLGLDVVPDKPTHANIVNIPPRENGNEIITKNLAEDLKNLSRLISE
jgi:hypothetical protein